MPTFTLNLDEVFSQGIPLLIIDLLLSSFLFYIIYTLLKGTKAIPLLKGLGVIFFFSVVSQKLNLKTFSGLLQFLLGAVVFATPVLFQPELRRALEQLGKRNFLNRWFPFFSSHSSEVLESVAGAAEELAASYIGGLIVLEREADLKDIEDSGHKLDAVVSKVLIRQIFEKNTPLHDGAVLVRGSRIAAAGCLLPLSQRINLPPELGTRHRAGIGLSEQSDALVIIISEERGAVSVAKSGQLVKMEKPGELLAFLSGELGERREGSPVPAANLVHRRMGE